MTKINSEYRKESRFSRSEVLIAMRQSKTFPGILFFSILSLMCLYVIQINLVVAAAYRISDYGKEIHDLSLETKDLQARHASSLSFRAIEDVAASLQFERVSNVRYVQVGRSVVARVSAGAGGFVR